MVVSMHIDELCGSKVHHETIRPPCWPLFLFFWMLFPSLRVSWKKKEGGCLSCGRDKPTPGRITHHSFFYERKRNERGGRISFFVCVCFESMAVDGEDDDRRERNSCCSTEQWNQPRSPQKKADWNLKVCTLAYRKIETRCVYIVRVIHIRPNNFFPAISQSILNFLFFTSSRFSCLFVFWSVDSSPNFLFSTGGHLTFNPCGKNAQRIFSF